MRLFRTQAPSSRVTLDEAKAQLNILTNSQDAHITSLINISEETLMSRTSTVFAPARYKLNVYNLSGDCVRFPIYPVYPQGSGTTGVVTVKGRLEGEDTFNTIAANEYYVEDNHLHFNEPQDFAEVEIDFWVGYNDEDFPQAMKGAVLMFIGTLFANRQSEMGNVVEKIPYGIEFLVQAHTYWNF
jgi:phage conserved hypothetical protein, phiE125 gp8 family